MRALAILLVCACSATGGTISGLYGTAQEWSWEIMPFGDYTNCVLWHTYEYEWDASTNYLDASASTNDGAQATANSRPSFTGANTATSSTYYAFDNIDDYIDTQYAPNVNPSVTPISIACWFKTDADNSANEAFWGSANGSNQRFYGSQQTQLTGDPIVIALGGGAGSSRIEVPWTVGEWGHAVLVCAGDDTSDLYTNGVFAASAANLDSFTTTGDIHVGRINGTSTYFDGGIDDVRIYNRELTAAEVLAIYDDTKLSHGVLGPNVLWLQFASDETPEYIDSTYYGNDGTQGAANAQATWVAASGVTNAHYEFDGTDDYITIPDDDSLEFGDGSTDSPFSVSAWIKMDDATVFRIASKTVSTSQRTWLLTFGGTDKISWLMYDDSGTTRIGRSDGPALTSHEGEWLLVTATYDGSSTAGGCTIYTNGAEQTSLSNVSGSYVAMHNNASDIVIGGITWVPDYADGAIDDLRIYSKELSAAEVADLHADTVGSHP